MILNLFIPTYYKNYNKVSASIWIRILQMKDYYESFGIKVYINNIFQPCDIAIMYRTSGKKSFYFIKFLKKISKKVYWDTCVNYYEEHEAASKTQVYYAKEISKLVDGVIVSTEYIKDKALSYNKNVFIMDDPINFNHFQYKKNNINFNSPIFGWSGISSKSIFLDKYKESYYNKLMIIAEKKPNLSMSFKYYKWKYESFPFLLTKCDIAFLPREYKNNKYNLGHSSFKALVFASQGIPIIANRLPSYEKLSNYYSGIVFLEDINYDIEKAISILSKRDLSNDKIIEYYSCENQAFRLLSYLGYFNE